MKKITSHPDEKFEVRQILMNFQVIRSDPYPDRIKIEIRFVDPNGELRFEDAVVAQDGGSLSIVVGESEGIDGE